MWAAASAARVHERVCAGEVGAREVERIVGRLEQRDRAPVGIERDLRLRLLEAEVAEGPVEPDAGVGVGGLRRLGERLGDDGASAGELAEVGEGEAEVRAEPHAGAEVVRGVPANLGERALEELDRPARRAARGVGPAERGVDVWPRQRVPRARLDDRLEVPDRLGVIGALEGGEPEGDAGAGGGPLVRGRDRLGEELLELVERREAVEAQAELDLGEAELARLGAGELGAGLQVLRGDPELPREQPERLHRRPARAGLDPGDVGVRDAGRGEVALGEAALAPQAAEPLADGLGLTAGVLLEGDHGPSDDARRPLCCQQPGRVTRQARTGT